ncbi:LysR substrate-binding domain-containing protein [Spirillospora sp. NPDC052269]
MCTSPGNPHATLHTEGRAVIVPSGHRLSARASVRMSDLDGRDAAALEGDPGGDGASPEVADVIQLLHMVTVGRMIGVLPRSLVEPVPPGLVCVPVTDTPPSRLVLAWNDQDHRPLVASFVTAALDPHHPEPRSVPEAPLAPDDKQPAPRALHPADRAQQRTEHPTADH